MKNAPHVEIPEIPEPFNIAAHLVDRHVDEGRANRTAILCEERSWTFAQIAECMNRVGNGLAGLGVQPGERVVLILPDSAEFVAAWFGALKIGAVAVPCNTYLRAADYGTAGRWRRVRSATCGCADKARPPATGTVRI